MDRGAWAVAGGVGAALVALLWVLSSGEPRREALPVRTAAPVVDERRAESEPLVAELAPPIVAVEAPSPPPAPTPPPPTPVAPQVALASATDETPKVSADDVIRPFVVSGTVKAVDRGAVALLSTRRALEWASGPSNLEIRRSAGEEIVLAAGPIDGAGSFHLELFGYEEPPPMDLIVLAPQGIVRVGKVATSEPVTVDVPPSERIVFDMRYVSGGAPFDAFWLGVPSEALIAARDGIDPKRMRVPAGFQPSPAMRAHLRREVDPREVARIAGPPLDRRRDTLVEALGTAHPELMELAHAIVWRAAWAGGATDADSPVLYVPASDRPPEAGDLATSRLGYVVEAPIVGREWRVVRGPSEASGTGPVELHCVLLPGEGGGGVGARTLRVGMETWDERGWTPAELPVSHSASPTLHVLGGVARCALDLEDAWEGATRPKRFFARLVLTADETDWSFSAPAWGWSEDVGPADARLEGKWLACGDVDVRTPVDAKPVPRDEDWTRVHDSRDGELLLRRGQRPLEFRPIVHHPLASVVCGDTYPPGIPASNLRFELRLLSAFDDERRHYARVWECQHVLETHAWTLLPDVRPPPLWSVDTTRSAAPRGPQ